MTDKNLLANLSKLGIPVFEPVEALDINKILAEVVQSNDTRLLEIFPVLLANAGDNYLFTPDEVAQHLKIKAHKAFFKQLMLLSGSLFSLYHLSFSWWNKLSKGFSNEEKKLINTWKKDLTNNHVLKLNNTELDPERLKGMFELYFENRAEKTRRRKEKFDEFSLEFALSQVFSPKQKELFKKKLEGLPLNKTEQEYYSRTVKKKVVALANSELHSLSKQLLQL